MQLKHSETMMEVESQQLPLIQEIRKITSKITEAENLEEYYREQLIQFNTRQMVMKNREEEYMNFLKQYSEKYEVESE